MAGDLLARDPELAGARDDDGATGLHLAVRHADVVRLLLDGGADPNARDVGDNALPLHFAAGGGHLDSARALLDAGSDVHGSGDLHLLDVIGWATVFRAPHRRVVDLLVERGARHHVFSALALGDLDLLRSVIVDEPDAISRRLSSYEQEQTALHYLIAAPDGLYAGAFRTGDHYAALDLLIELGADLEARDAKGRTPLRVAMLRGDREAMTRLHAAGAEPPEPPGPVEDPSAAAASVEGLAPMLKVPDMAATVAWYRTIGFELCGLHEDDGQMQWASLTLGDCEIMLVPSSDVAREPTSGLTLWLGTDRLDDLYAHFARRQLEHARATLAGEEPPGPPVPFTVDLYKAFYGQREFGLRDPNGVELMFYQPD